MKVSKLAKMQETFQQVTRGHNIVADGWAGASNPHQHPNLPPTLKFTQKVSKLKRSFPRFSARSPWQTDGWPNGRMNGRKNGQTDRLTDKGSYRVACPQLKNQWFTMQFFCQVLKYWSIKGHDTVEPHSNEPATNKIPLITNGNSWSFQANFFYFCCWQ